MERTIIDEEYMHLGTSHAARKYLEKLKDRCYLFDGDFTFLWHCRRMNNKGEKELYKSLISSTN
jgi:hypothetical protein